MHVFRYRLLFCFIFLGPADTVKCFSCDGVLRNWSLEDDPWIEHAVWYPGCNFLLAIKGHDFVEAILRRKEQSRVMVQYCCCAQ